MSLDETPAAHFLQADSVDPADLPQDPPSVPEPYPDEGIDSPYPAPPDFGDLERGYVVEIYGDERGGQTPTRPERQGDQEL
jgi:hypothetical protein